RQIVGLIDEDAGNAPILLINEAKLFQHLFIRKFSAPRENHVPRQGKEVWINDAFKDTVGANPFVRWIVDVLFLEFERSSVIDIIADVFFVRENLVNGSACPGSAI